MSLPRSVVVRDQQLETAVNSAAESLARHRWHWTLDTSNADRVSLREYAREVARDPRTIGTYAKGYALWQGEGGTSLTLNEAMERARMGSETEIATEAVAEARGLAFGTVRQGRSTEMRRVREIARERAEKHGTRIEDEASQVASYIVKAEQASERLRSARRDRLGARYIEMERKLDAVKRYLVEAVNLAHDIDWGDEEKDLLQSSLANIKSLLNLIDVAFVGAADVDWDTELAKLTGDIDSRG